MRVMPSEVLALWLVETALATLILSAFAAADRIVDTGWPDPHLLRDAAAWSVVIGCIVAGAGLYRPRLWHQSSAQLVGAAATVLIALTLLTVLGATTGRFAMAWQATDNGGIQGLIPLRAMLCWLACLFATRLPFTLGLCHPGGGAPSLAREGLPGGRQTRNETRRIWTRRSSGAMLRLAGVKTERTGASSILEAVLFADDVGLRGRSAQPAASEPVAALDRATARALSCKPGESVMRRAGDVLIAGLCLLLTGPLMALVAVLVRLDSRGPALYRQDRVGLDGRIFTLLKFRSMQVEGAPGGCSLPDGRRITRVGMLIRRTRIDELPQVFNVLRGEMSVIGPRAEQPHFLAHWIDAIPHYRDRLSVKPGVTGWAQVHLADGPTYEDACTKLSFDLHYIRHRTVEMDLRILLALGRMILFDDSAR
jgi:lipopolysaccharide/colanic/teichoic acid biosynthesis glycosyltransferase